MAQRLQQPADPEAVEGRAEEHRHDQALTHLTDQVGEHRVAAGGDVGEQLFQQVVVEVGDLFQHMKARVDLLGLELAGDVHLFGRLAGPVDEAALQSQVDVAADLVAVPGGDLPGHQGRGGDRGQGRQQVCKAAPGLIHLVDEQGVRDAEALQLAKRRLQQHGFGGVRLGHHDGQIHGRKRRIDLGAEFQRTGTIDNHIAVAHEIEAGHVQLHRMTAGAGFGAGIADLAGAHRHAGGGLQQGFHQGCLAGARGADERERPNRPLVLDCHGRSPITSGAPGARSREVWRRKRGLGAVAEPYRSASAARSGNPTPGVSRWSSADRWQARNLDTWTIIVAPHLAALGLDRAHRRWVSRRPFCA